MSGNGVAAFPHQRGRQIECGTACAQTREIRPTDWLIVSPSKMSTPGETSSACGVVGRVPG